MQQTMTPTTNEKGRTYMVRTDELTALRQELQGHIEITILEALHKRQPAIFQQMLNENLLVAIIRDKVSNYHSMVQQRTYRGAERKQAEEIEMDNLMKMFNLS